MHAWLAETQRLLARGEPAVLVTVAKVEGSAPREAGAKLLVTREHQWQTIGGGHLEWRAADIARQMLKQAGGRSARRIERLSLGRAWANAAAVRSRSLSNCSASPIWAG